MSQSPAASVDEERIDMTVITALEFQYLVSSRERAREAHRAHGRLCAAGDKPHHLDVRHSLANQFAELHLELGRHSEARSVLHRAG